MSSNIQRDFYLDPDIMIKQEPTNNENNMVPSASVPIPVRRDISDYRGFGFDLETSQSPIFDSHRSDSMIGTELFSGSSIWMNGRLINPDELLKSEDSIQMDDDDIFQVDKADLIQGPTLAELNANDENLLGVGDLNFDDLLLPEEGTYITLDRITPYNVQFNANNNSSCINNNQNFFTSSSCPQQGLKFYKELDGTTPLASSYDMYTTGNSVSTLSPGSPHSSNSSVVHSSSSPLHISNSKQKPSTLHELLMKRDSYPSPDSTMLGQSVPGTRNSSMTSPTIKMQRSMHVSRLSSSAPTHLGMDQIWQRREPRKHLLSTSSLAEAGSTSSLSTGGIVSPDIQDFSHDELDSDEDSDVHYDDDYSTDNDSDDDEDHPGMKRASKREKYFWQYNVQAKGPKGQRLVTKSKLEDPHRLHEVTDPVFSPDCAVRGIKHSGKARKGDGNDLTPNPRKLHNIGKELDKLGRIINDMTPVSELPFNIRSSSRKEKNKLASRACRLKKKAQHEANKIKLSGLEVEHRRYLTSIAQIKQFMMIVVKETDSEKQEELLKNVDKISKPLLKTKIAGNTTEYVNKILEKIRNGNTSATFYEDL